jgi:hypothetical protein
MPSQSRGRIRCKRSDPENLQMFAQARRILYQRLWSCHSHFARKRPQPQVYIFSKALYKCSSQKIRPAGTVGASRSWTFGPWCAIFFTLRFLCHLLCSLWEFWIYRMTWFSLCFKELTKTSSCVRDKELLQIHCINILAIASTNVANTGTYFLSMENWILELYTAPAWQSR